MPNAISKFNGLGAAAVSRNYLEELKHQAEKEGNHEIVSRISTLLEAYPDGEEFTLEVDNPVQEVSGLGGLSISDFQFLDYEEASENEEVSGLNKAVSPNDIYQMLTDKMIKLIKKAKKEDYVRKWKTKGYLIAYNFESKKPYKGINQIVLGGIFEPIDNPYYLTFKQVQELGGTIKKGSIGHEVIYYTKYDKEVTKQVRDEFGKETGETKEVTESFFAIKYYNVFNGNDIEGIDFDLDNFPLRGKLENEIVTTGNNKPIEAADLIIKNYPKPQPTIKHGGNKAYFDLENDLIQLPDFQSFESSQDYYRTALHELSHSTLLPNRLNRNPDISIRKEYAFEELVAEFGAVFLSSQAGIIFYTNKNHAAYLKGWNEALTQMKNDNRFFIKASAAAQKIADYILQPDSNGVFLFTKGLNKKTKAKLPAKPKKETAAPESFADKPKSVSVATAIKDVLSLPNFKGIKELQASIIYKHFKNRTENLSEDEYQLIESDYEKGVLKNKSRLHDFYFDEELFLTAKGYEFVKSVNDRLESLRNQKHNFSLFKGLKGVAIDTDKFRNMSVAELRRFTLDYYNSHLKGKKVSIKNALKEVVFVTDTGRKMLKPMYSEKAAVVEHLEELIKKSTYNNWGNRKEKDSPDVLGYLNFKSKLSIDEKKRHVRISIIIDRDRKTKLKSVEVGKIKKSGKSREVAVTSPKVEGEKPLPENKDTEKGLNSPNFENVTTYENQEVIILDAPEPVKQVQNTSIVNHAPVVVHSTQTEKINSAVRDTVSHVPLVQNKQAQIIREVSPKHQTLRDLLNNDEVNQLFDIPGDVGELFGDIEIKPKGSVVVTLSSPQGGGKTRAVLQFANALAVNYRVKIFSLEEQKESSLFKGKVRDYIAPQNIDNISADSELPNGIETIHSAIKDFDVIIVDSWSKMLEIDSRLNLDQDFRKKYDGKLFIFIFQQTSDGKMYGGAKNQFDGDVILFVEKFPDYRLSYIYPDKHRYTSTPLDQLRYNIFTQSLMREEAEETEPTEVIQL
ncbi:hypothetical protein FLJC2902T_17650 [Flavobacterium limnosediminis JC2902]|uniref:Antirestriction protein n=1 Tax=Flavobacterium limnosediminis JC2902 TaxID=1341181 RepID=V6SVE5_9FLAO|nr:zincin-like metallopeptidase domain-containing protein [Flavobacterium limnosediminis]ESU28405.1 hypothetical protein FLJC2902T_17650 [Flavobacterium limnosediminis JC2902]